MTACHRADSNRKGNFCSAPRANRHANREVLLVNKITYSHDLTIPSLLRNLRLSRWKAPRGLVSLILVVLSTVLAAAGCGQSGPARYEVRGTVTYGGQPVPAGQVIFEPDSEKNNTGPPAYARIQDGQYRTQPGKGVVGGPHLVRIIGTTGQPTPEMPQGQMLFPEYRLKVDLPRSNAVRNFEVPK